MIICHFSDWQGRWAKLPTADLYICTGNMLSNYPVGDEINFRHEIFRQGKQIISLLGRRSLFGNPVAPVIVLRGHRDFLPLSKLFGKPVVELHKSASSVTLRKFPEIRLGGFRGISRRLGEWPDEMSKSDLDASVNGLAADLNILVTHAPVYGMMDNSKSSEGYPIRTGLPALIGYIEKNKGKRGPLRLHCFGHSPEFGIRKQDGITYSNAHGGFIVLEWKEGDFQVVRIAKNALKRTEDGHRNLLESS